MRLLQRKGTLGRLVGIRAPDVRGRVIAGTVAPSGRRGRLVAHPLIGPHFRDVAGDVAAEVLRIAPQRPILVEVLRGEEVHRERIWMRGAGLESPVGDAWAAAPAERSYRSPASPTRACRSLGRSCAPLLPGRWRLSSEQHHGKHCHEQRASAARGTDSHTSLTPRQLKDSFAESYHAAAADKRSA